MLTIFVHLAGKVWCDFSQNTVFYLHCMYRVYILNGKHKLTVNCGINWLPRQTRLSLQWEYKQNSGKLSTNIISNHKKLSRILKTHLCSWSKWHIANVDSQSLFVQYFFNLRMWRLNHSIIFVFVALLTPLSLVRRSFWSFKIVWKIHDHD